MLPRLAMLVRTFDAGESVVVVVVAVPKDEGGSLPPLLQLVHHLELQLADCQTWWPALMFIRSKIKFRMVEYEL